MRFRVDPNNQDEFDDEFAEALSEINEAVASSAAPLEGNLFYVHHAADCTVPRPAGKRRNFCLALRGKRHLLEIGFNAGHSALIACASNPELQYTGVDICHHAYTETCLSILTRHFRGRFSLIPGDSRDVLPRLALDRRRFDLFHIDGSHYPDTVIADVMNSIRLADPVATAHVILDDTQLSSQVEIFDLFCERGFLTVDTLGGEWRQDHHVLGRVLARA